MSSKGITSGTLAYASRKLLGHWFSDGFTGYRTQILAWIELNTISLLIYVVDGVIDEGWDDQTSTTAKWHEKKIFWNQWCQYDICLREFCSVLTWISGFYVGSDCCKNVVLTFNTNKTIF